MNSNNNQRDFRNLTELIRELSNLSQQNNNNGTTFNINYYESGRLSSETNLPTESRNIESLSNTFDRLQENINNNSRQNMEVRGISIPIPVIRTSINSNNSNNLNNSNTDINNIIIDALNDTINNIDESNSEELKIKDLLEKTQIKLRTDIESTDETKCHICNDEYKSNDICRINTECNHFFHCHCIDNWFSTNNTCPICNRKISS